MHKQHWSSHLFQKNIHTDALFLAKEMQTDAVSLAFDWKSVLLEFEESLAKGHTHFIAEYMKAFCGLSHPVFDVHFRFPLFFQERQRTFLGLKSLLENQFQIPFFFQEKQEQLVYQDRPFFFSEKISKRRFNKPGVRWMMLNGKGFSWKTKFEIQVGPISFADFQKWDPQKKLFQDMCYLVDDYLNAPHKDYSFRFLVLPPVQFPILSRLNFDFFLLSQRKKNYEKVFFPKQRRSWSFFAVDDFHKKLPFFDFHFSDSFFSQRVHSWIKKVRPDYQKLLPECGIVQWVSKKNHPYMRLREMQKISSSEENSFFEEDSFSSEREIFLLKETCFSQVKITNSSIESVHSLNDRIFLEKPVPQEVRSILSVEIAPLFEKSVEESFFAEMDECEFYVNLPLEKALLFLQCIGHECLGLGLLSQTLEREQGREQGRKQGREQGREQSREQRPEEKQKNCFFQIDFLEKKIYPQNVFLQPTIEFNWAPCQGENWIDFLGDLNSFCQRFFFFKVKNLKGFFSSKTSKIEIQFYFKKDLFVQLDLSWKKEFLQVGCAPVWILTKKQQQERKEKQEQQQERQERQEQQEQQERLKRLKRLERQQERSFSFILGIENTSVLGIENEKFRFLTSTKRQVRNLCPSYFLFGCIFQHSFVQFVYEKGADSFFRLWSYLDLFSHDVFQQIILNLRDMKTEKISRKVWVSHSSFVTKGIRFCFTFNKRREDTFLFFRLMHFFLKELCSKESFVEFSVRDEEGEVIFELPAELGKT